MHPASMLDWVSFRVIQQDSGKQFFMTDPKVSKSVITQLFLGSLYRAVLVFWLKNMWNFAFQSFPIYIHLTKPSPHLQTTWDTNRHHQTPANGIWCQHERPNILSLFGYLGKYIGDAWCQLVSVVVLNCPKIARGGFWEHNIGVYVCLWGLDASRDVYEWLSLVEANALHWKSSKGQNSSLMTLLKHWNTKTAPYQV